MWFAIHNSLPRTCYRALPAMSHTVSRFYHSRGNGVPPGDWIDLHIRGVWYSGNRWDSFIAFRCPNLVYEENKETILMMLNAGTPRSSGIPGPVKRGCHWRFHLCVCHRAYMQCHEGVCGVRNLRRDRRFPAFSLSRTCTSWRQMSKSTHSKWKSFLLIPWKWNEWQIPLEIMVIHW